MTKEYRFVAFLQGEEGSELIDQIDESNDPARDILSEYVENLGDGSPFEATEPEFYGYETVYPYGVGRTIVTDTNSRYGTIAIYETREVASIAMLPALTKIRAGVYVAARRVPMGTNWQSYVTIRKIGNQWFGYVSQYQHVAESRANMANPEKLTARCHAKTRREVLAILKNER